MPTTEMIPGNILTAAAVLPADSPITMLNLVRYNEHALYPDRADLAPCSGREAYLQRYAPTFNRIAATIGVTGVQVQYLGNVLAGLVAPPGEQWDDIVLVEYPNFAAFRGIVESPLYEAEAAQHRKAALADWRLLATKKVALP